MCDRFSHFMAEVIYWKLLTQKSVHIFFMGMNTFASQNS